MTGSSSSSSRSSTRRCPKCRRRQGRFSLMCQHCAYQVPYRQVYLMLIALGLGLVGVAVVLGVKQYLVGPPPLDPQGVRVGRPKK